MLTIPQKCPNVWWGNFPFVWSEKYTWGVGVDIELADMMQENYNFVISSHYSLFSIILETVSTRTVFEIFVTILGRLAEKMLLFQILEICNVIHIKSSESIKEFIKIIFDAFHINP